MFEIKITVDCPDLVKAASLLASAMGGIKIEEPTITNPAHPVNPAPEGVAANLTIGGPLVATPGGRPSNAAPVTNVPLAPAPAFTPQQVCKAGADLITAQPAKMQELMGLLAQFGVQTVDALRPDQLGTFATALRGMGAQI